MHNRFLPQAAFFALKHHVTGKSAHGALAPNRLANEWGLGTETLRATDSAQELSGRAAQFGIR